MKERISDKGVAVGRYTINMHDGLHEFEVVVSMRELARSLSYRARKNKTRRAMLSGGAVVVSLVGAPGHSDDCPKQKGGECVYPCHMQPTSRRKR